MEEALVLSEKRYSKVARHSRTVIWEIDLKGMFTYVNDIGESVYGYPVDELVGKKYFHDLRPAYFRDILKTKLDEPIRMGNPITNFDNPIQSKDGSLIWLLTNGSPIIDENQQIIGYRGADNDITKRKHVEDELQKFRAISDQANYGAAIFSIDGTLIYANEAFAWMHGWKVDNLIGQKRDDLYNGEQKKRVDFLLDPPNFKEGLVAVEVWRTRKDGSVFPSITSAKVIFDSQGFEQLVSVNVIDITEMKRKESELRKLSIAIEQSPVAIFITDTEAEIQYANPSFEKITGHACSEVIGKSAGILQSGQTSEALYKEFRNAIQSGLQWKGEWINKRKNGDFYYTSISVTPIFDENGVITNYLSIQEDITERKNVEEALRQSEKQFRTLFMESPVAIRIHDKDTGEIVDANPEACIMRGLSSPEELILYNLWSEPPYSASEALAWIKKTVSKGRQQLEWLTCKINGEEIWENINLNAIEIDGIKRVMATGVDITTIKQAEKDRVARIAAEEANLAKSTFLSNMSHEIRTPLNAIIGFAQILRRDTSLTSKQNEQIKTILRSGEHLITLINDILELSRIEAGRNSLKEGEFSLADLLDDLLAMLGMRAREKGLDLFIETHHGVPKYVVADEAKLRQVLINLMGNAVKFTVTGRVNVSVKIDDSIYGYDPKGETDLLLLIEVEDTGPGIPEQDIERIFETFYQAEAGRMSGGTGLGLTISAKLIELMGGRLSVESWVGIGSIFSFAIPVKRSEEQVKPSKFLDRVLKLESGTGPFRILIVDDKKDNRDMLRETLNVMGFETKEAIDGKEAIVVFEQWDPHAVLMDMRMPVMDGYEATSRIKKTEKGKSTLVVAVTASAFDVDMERIMAVGTDVFLSKPIHLEEMLQIFCKIPGLRYIFDEDKSLISGKGKIELLNREELALLPKDLLQEMKEAVVQGNMHRFKELITQVEMVDVQIASGLRILAKEYNYDRLNVLFSDGMG